jgi:hypothetical protein
MEKFRKGERVGVEYAIAPGLQRGFEQNPPQEPVTDNPATIDNRKAKDQACQVEVSFTGSGSRGLQNGPSTMTLNNRGQVFGIGFTVKISGLSGPINIVSEAKDRRPKTAWNIEQYVADFNKRNGVVVRQDGAAHLEELRRAAPVVDGGTVEWWDHPGTAVSGNSQYFTKRNFYIKAYKSKQREVSFHLTFRLFFGKPVDTGWGDGPYP